MTAPGRLPIGQLVEYDRHTPKARGGVTTTRALGAVTGYYGPLYLITSRFGGHVTREETAAIVRTIKAYPPRTAKAAK